MDTEIDNEHTRLFDIILNEYDIKNKDRLKSCIINVFSGWGRIGIYLNLNMIMNRH
jgi:hypothetical protein